jgi:hypothetical protein
LRINTKKSFCFFFENLTTQKHFFKRRFLLVDSMGVKLLSRFSY